MSFTTREPEDNFELIPAAAVYNATCVGIYDLGTQPGGMYEPAKKLIIQWELADVKTSDGKPITISKNYTNSLHEKANLRKDLEAWRGKKFTADEAKGFDLRKVLKAACQLQVIHTKRDEKEYANIATIMSLAKGTVTPLFTINPVCFSFEETIDPPDNTPEWILKKIKVSPEYINAHDGSYIPPGEGDLEPF
jgi:hypothetical protein